MHLGTTTPASSPAAQPLRVNVNISTLADGERWGTQRSDQVDARFGEELRASHQTYDPLWDGPVPEPEHPGNWNTRVPAAAASPALRQALQGLRAQVTDLDWGRAPHETTGATEYATVHATYAERPEGAARAWQETDGTWTAYARTSIDDLLADPLLAPVVEAARAVLAAAHPAA